MLIIEKIIFELKVLHLNSKLAWFGWEAAVEKENIKLAGFRVFCNVYNICNVYKEDTLLFCKRPAFASICQGA